MSRVATSGRRVSILAVLLSACGGAPPVVPQAASGTGKEAMDPPEVEDLTVHLPRGADRCTVGRPQVLSARRREEFALVSRLPSGLWSPSLRVQVVVAVERARRGSRRGRVIALRSELADAELRAALDSDLGIDLRWVDAGPRRRAGEVVCGPDGCPGSARMVGPHTVVIESGQWLAPSDAVGVEAECRMLVRSAPDAMEWTVTRGQSLKLSGGPMMPMRSSVVVRPRGRAAVSIHRDRMITPELAAEAAVAPSHSSPAAGGRQLARVQEDDEVVTVREVLWEDLRLRIDDRARIEAARADAERILRLRPDDEVDVSRVDRVHAQLSYRLALIESASAAERPVLRAGLLRLLRRAVAAHPDEVDLTRMLVERLIVTDARSAAEAATVAAAQLDHPEQGEAFRRLRKHALSIADVDALATVLAEEGIARRAAAAAAARDIAALVAAGSDYGPAEQAWSLTAGLSRRAARTPLRPVREVSLPLSSLIDGLLALRHLGAATGQLHVLVQHAGDLSSLSQVRGPAVMSERALLRIDPGEHARGRAAGEALAGAGLSGPLELAMPSRERGRRIVRLRGEVTGGRFTLQATDAASARVDWERVRRWLLSPLSEFAGGRFLVPTDSPGEAARLMRLASGAFGIACRRRPDGLSCSARGVFADRGRAALLAMVAKRLADDAERLWKK